VDLECGPMIVPEHVMRGLRAATGRDRAFADDMLSGRVKCRECVHDGRVVGHCVGNSATGEILSLSVNDSYRRRGIARTLLSLVVNLMRGEGAQRIWVAAPADPASSAYSLYRAVGWRPSGEPRPGADTDEILELPTF
jgi:ribosomal protein S18 acetylase RimI-like enzyme